MSEQPRRATALTWAVLLLAAAAAGFAGARLSDQIAPAMPAATSGEAARAEAAALAHFAERLTEIERRLSAPDPARASAEPRDPSPPGRQPAIEPQHLQQIEARLAALERTLAALPQAADARSSQPERREAPDPAETARTIASHQQRILDPAATAEQKREAWRNLRSLENAYSDAVVDQIIALGLSSPEPELRADVWRQADGRSRHPALAVAMIRALQSDPDAQVREEAAESLENYAERPDVQQVLTWARDSDANDGVRRYAARSLERAKRPGR